jgi:hypothetical protein
LFEHGAQRFGAWLSGGLEVQMFKLALMLIEVQMLNLALLPPFCQTPVTCWASSVVVALSVHSCCVLVRLLASSFYFFSVALCVEKNKMCLQMGWV